MLLLDQTLTVDIEILNANDLVLTETSARLTGLMEEQADLLFSGNAAVVGLHWGAKVRFRVCEGQEGYEITGSVIRIETLETEENSGDREVHLRLWECHPIRQRRTLPRRRARMDVTLKPLSGETAHTAQDEVEGQCVDVGAGGIRVRIPGNVALSERLEVRFILPHSEQELTFRGRILRSEPKGRSGNFQEIAIRFERLAVADGLALADYIQE